MSAYDNVGEMIVVSNNPNTSFAYKHEKVTILDMVGYEESLGVAVRFKACLLAIHQHILIVGDDLLVTEHGLLKLLRDKHAHPWSLIGFWGRDFDHTNPEYVYQEVQSGYHDIALTRALLLDSCACRAFWDASHLMEDLAHAAAVIWNGEDIFMSLVSTKVTGALPFISDVVADVDVGSLQEGTVGISLGQNDLQHRSRFLQVAVQRLACF